VTLEQQALEQRVPEQQALEQRVTEQQALEQRVLEQQALARLLAAAWDLRGRHPWALEPVPARATAARSEEANPAQTANAS
jgi:hypothetical protein